MRVLLVEDEPEMVTALRAALARHDMIVDHAPDLREAEVIAAEGNYDAIVLDRQLPDGDGLPLTQNLREGGKAVPVRVPPARGELAARVNALERGADDYPGKPFAFEDLRAGRGALLRRPAAVQS